MNSSEFQRTASAYGPGLWCAEECDSTNTAVLNRPAASFADGACFRTVRQTAGRGRLGRTWHAKPGSSLTFTVAFKHAPALDAVTWMHFAAALAVVDLSESLSALIDSGARLWIKWPNDVVGAAGHSTTANPPSVRPKKLCGVLTETAAEPSGGGFRVAVGVGLNVNLDSADFPDDLRDTATSLSQIAGGPLEPGPLLERWLHHFSARHADIAAQATQRLHADLRRHNWILGHTVEIATPAGPLSGRALDIDPHGRLILQTPTGLVKTLDTGEVTRVRPSAAPLNP